MPDNNEPPGDAEGKSTDDKVPMQRRNFGTKRSAIPAPDEARPDLEEKLAHLVDSVKVLQTHITGGRPAGETAAEAEPKQRRLKRFQRTASEEATEPEGDATLDHEVRGTEATLNKNIAWPRLTRADEVGANFRAQGSGRRHPIIVWVLVQVTGLGLLLLGYWAGQSFSDEEDRPNRSELPSPASNPVADPLARVGINDRAFGAVNAGLRAEKTGDLKTARKSWEAAVAGDVRLPGADYRLAMLDFQAGEYTNADIHLTASLAAGEMMASCYFMNAIFYARKSNYAEAARQMSHAVRVEPFHAKYLFCLGESLRRAGKAQAAIDAFVQALDRPASPSDVELFTFKMRLAKVELGQDEAFENEFTAHLANAPVAGDWLLLAAARDLSRGAFPAAAGHLADAARALPPDVFNALVQDFAFQGYATHAEVGTLLKVPSPPASVGPLDPGAWPADEADPGVWKPFSPAL